MADGFDWGSLIGAIGNYMNQRNQMSHLGDSLPLSDSEQWKLDRAKELYNYSPTRAMMGNGAEQTAGMFNAARNYSPHYQSAYMHGQEGAMPKLPAFDPSFIHAFYQPMSGQGAGGAASPSGGRPGDNGSSVDHQNGSFGGARGAANGPDLGHQGGVDSPLGGSLDHSNDIPSWAYDPRSGMNDADRNNLRALLRVAPGIAGALSGLPISAVANALRSLWSHYSQGSQQQPGATPSGQQAGSGFMTGAAGAFGGGAVNPDPRTPYQDPLGNLRGSYNAFWENQNRNLGDGSGDTGFIYQ